MAVHALTPAIVPANAILGAVDTVLGRSIVATAGRDPLARILNLAALMPRQDVEATIDAMIAALDAADGDADSEHSDNDCCAAGDDDPKRCGTPWCPDDDREGLTWPERDQQPGMMHGGLGVRPEDMDDDMEPWRTPAHWPEGDAA